MRVKITAQSVYGAHPLQMFTDKYKTSLTLVKTYNRTVKSKNNVIDRGIYAIDLTRFADFQNLYQLVGFKPLMYDGKQITIMDEEEYY